MWGIGGVNHLSSKVLSLLNCRGMAWPPFKLFSLHTLESSSLLGESSLGGALFPASLPVGLCWDDWGQLTLWAPGLCIGTSPGPQVVPSPLCRAHDAPQDSSSSHLRPLKKA
jgi:hypothetical protein